MQKPLSEQMRPKSLDEVIGQRHLVAHNGVLRRMIEQQTLPSIVLWGPPGVGKTTLAYVIAQQVDLPFVTLSAISAGVKEVREVIAQAKGRRRTILFIDEIHRFNKSQQDALLGAVEQGVITLIGATTENPSFEVNPALLSRCQVYTLMPLVQKDLEQLLARVQNHYPPLSTEVVIFKETEALFGLSDGDARRFLNLLELIAAQQLTGQKLEVTNQLVMSLAQQKTARYDKSGEQHYDIISAFIKSIRGSDPNGAIYWLARMMSAGEDAKFIARRLIIAAAEDIGIANPTALVVANECFQAVNVTGYPEAEIILAQATVYLAASAKSNTTYLALRKAQALIKETGDLPVPLHLRNAPTKLMKDQGYSKGYKYPHDYPGHFTTQGYLPAAIENKCFYKPGKNSREEEIRKRLQLLWGAKYGYDK